MVLPLLAAVFLAGAVRARSPYWEEYPADRIPGPFPLLDGRLVARVTSLTHNTKSGYVWITGYVENHDKIDYPCDLKFSATWLDKSGNKVFTSYFSFSPVRNPTAPFLPVPFRPGGYLRGIEWDSITVELNSTNEREAEDADRDFVIANFRRTTGMRNGVETPAYRGTITNNTRIDAVKLKMSGRIGDRPRHTADFFGQVVENLAPGETREFEILASSDLTDQATIRLHVSDVYHVRGPDK